MKITVLGSGIGASQIPNVPNRFPPGFIVEAADEKILFDCSEGIRFRLEQAGYDYADIHHVAISHLHPDHFALVNYIQSVFIKGECTETQNHKIDIYGPDLLSQEFNALWNIQIPEFLDGKFPGLDLQLHAMSDGKQTFRISDNILTAKKVYHGFAKCDAIAFRLETPEGVFVYSGDTGSCDAIKEISVNADIFVCEASARVGNDAEATGYGHLTPKIAGEISKDSGVKKLALFHYSGLDSDKDLIEDVKKSGFAGEVIIAKDFMTLNL